MKLFSYVEEGYSPATEVIDHQRDNSAFKKSLTDQIATIQEKIETGTYTDIYDIYEDGTELREIEKLVLDRTGVKIRSLEISKGSYVLYRNQAFISALGIDNVLHPFLSQVNKGMGMTSLGTEKGMNGVFDKETINTILRNRKDAVVVDTKNGKLITKNDQESPLFVDYYGFTKSKLAPGEIAGVLMHEVGHVFTWTAFGSKLAAINNSLYTVMSRKHMKDSDKSIVSLNKELTSLDLDVTDAEIEGMLSEDEVIAAPWYVGYIAKNTSIENLSTFLKPSNDEFQSENLADLYSARMGFGPDLMSGYLKIVNIPSIGTYVTYALSAVNMLTLLVLVSKMVHGPLSVGGPTLLYKLVVSLFIEAITLHVPEIYRDSKERTQKMYNDVVDSIKTQEYTTSEKKRIISQLSVMRDTIDTARTGNTISKRLLSMVFASRGKDFDYRVQQDTLEKLASNELFVKALKLELLGEKR